MRAKKAIARKPIRRTDRSNERHDPPGYLRIRAGVEQLLALHDSVSTVEV